MRPSFRVAKVGEDEDYGEGDPRGKDGVGEVEVAERAEGDELFAEVLGLDLDEGKGEAEDGVTDNNRKDDQDKGEKDFRFAKQSH